MGCEKFSSANPGLLFGMDGTGWKGGSLIGFWIGGTWEVCFTIRRR